ncbi:MAG: radical SAM protein, partial [Ginsengibacter sp.]
MNNIEHADIELYSLLKARLNKLREVAPGTTDRKKNLRRLLYKIDHADAEKSFKSYNKFINPGNKSLLFSKKYPSTFLIKPAGDACNMRCTYCYEVDRLMNNHQKIMPVATVEKIINDLLTNGNQVDIFFHGGEPLLAGKIFFQHAVNVIRQHPNGKNIVVGVQTNGTLIDDEWACLFAENNFQVGISLDGDKNLN